MPDYRIEIEFAEPLFCGSRHAVSNEMTSLEFIPGTSLRGSLAAELAYSGRRDDVPIWFAATGPLWTPALPSPSVRLLRTVADDHAFAVPMPLSFLREKSDGDPFTGRSGVYNTLLCGDLPEEQQWTRIGSKWLVVSRGLPFDALVPRRSTSMHVGLHYGRQANREQALFSRRAMAAENKFVAWVRDPSGVMANFPSSIVVGKRSSAGNGFASLRWKEGPFPWLGSGGSESPEATVQLIGDAILQDEKGRYLQGLNAGQWSRILGVNVAVKAAAVATRRIRTWSNSWGLPKQDTLAIAAGSVFRLVPEGKGGPAWKAALDRLAQQGLGRMRHEGFGWVSVNPSWLTKDFYEPRVPGAKEQERQRKRDPKPEPWPGMEAVERKLVLEAFAMAKAVQGRIREHIQKIGDLASYAARVQDPADVVMYLDGLATRTNPRGWKEISDAIGEQLRALKSIELIRFFLNGIETMHG